MTATISIGDDIKDYLSSRNGEKSSFKSNINNLINGNKVSKSVSDWFYQPLSTEDVNDSELDSQLNAGRKASTSSWLSSLSINTQKSETCSWLPSLSRSQRIIGFIICIAMGIFCFALSSFYIPFLILKARKFALMFTLGSIFIVSSFAILWGPASQLKHLFSKERLPFTLSYFGSLFMTLYFALKVQSTPLTTLFAVIQVIALIWYVISYIPGGQTGLMFFSKIFTRAASKSLPV